LTVPTGAIGAYHAGAFQIVSKIGGNPANPVLTIESTNNDIIIGSLTTPSNTPSRLLASAGFDGLTVAKGLINDTVVNPYMINGSVLFDHIFGTPVQLNTVSGNANYLNEWDLSTLWVSRDQYDLQCPYSCTLFVDFLLLKFDLSAIPTNPLTVFLYLAGGPHDTPVTSPITTIFTPAGLSLTNNVVQFTEGTGTGSPLLMKLSNFEIGAGLPNLYLNVKIVGSVTGVLASFTEFAVTGSLECYRNSTVLTGSFIPTYPS
jgi:hypothetical protein